MKKKKKIVMFSLNFPGIFQKFNFLGVSWESWNFPEFYKNFQNFPEFFLKINFFGISWKSLNFPEFSKKKLKIQEIPRK